LNYQITKFKFKTVSFKDKSPLIPLFLRGRTTVSLPLEKGGQEGFNNNYLELMVREVDDEN
jgi:hypothetical protein